MQIVMRKGSNAAGRGQKRLRCRVVDGVAEKWHGEVDEVRETRGPGECLRVQQRKLNGQRTGGVRFVIF